MCRQSTFSSLWSHHFKSVAMVPVRLQLFILFAYVSSFLKGGESRIVHCAYWLVLQISSNSVDNKMKIFIILGKKQENMLTEFVGVCTQIIN